MDNTLDNTCRRPISCIYFTPHKIINFNTDKVMHPYGQLGWLEHLCSEDTPCRLMIIHSIESYWIPSQKKTKSKLQILKNSPKFHICKILKQTLHATHLLKLLDKMCKYEMDPTSTVEDTEGTGFCPQTDRQTDRQGETSIPPFQLRWSGGYNKSCQYLMFRTHKPCPS